MDDMFWESVDQANTRLRETYVMYGDDPVYVHDVRSHPDTGVPAALIFCKTPGHKFSSKGEWKSLSDPLFHSYHKLPPLGFMNIYGGDEPRAAYLRRLTNRGTKHGLMNGRIAIHELQFGTMVPSAHYNYTTIIKDRGYRDRVNAEYPSVGEIIEKLPLNCSAAFSPKYAISKDQFGTIRLWRRLNCIGTINDGGIILTKTTECYTEELQESSFCNIPIKR